MGKSRFSMDWRSSGILRERLGEPDAGSITDDEAVALESRERPLQTLRIQVRKRRIGGQRRDDAAARVAVGVLERRPPDAGAGAWTLVRPLAPRRHRAGAAARGAGGADRGAEVHQRMAERR